MNKPDNGFNPMRWDCNDRGCYNIKQRPKIEIFADCFPGRISLGDVDASIVEINCRALLLEWKSAPVEMPAGQHIMFSNLSRTGWLVVMTVAGDAETMNITHCGFYIGGQFDGWREADLAYVKQTMTRWAKKAKSLPAPEFRKALPKERMSKLEREEWVADYIAHEHEFDELLRRAA